ncbi:MAG: dynamin family protein [Sphingobacteriaceae bacterium]
MEKNTKVIKGKKKGAPKKKTLIKKSTKLSKKEIKSNPKKKAPAKKTIKQSLLIKEKEVLPIRHSNHIKEDQSLIYFKQAILPWVVTDIKGNEDYGIDAIVEITKDKLKSENKLVTGKKFNVQIKSTASIETSADFSVSVKRTTFLYWYQNNLPVFILLTDLKNKLIYYRFVNDKLMSEISKMSPDWHANDNVTIKFVADQVLDAKSISLIEQTVYKWTYKPKKIITPGAYYSHVNEAVDFVKTLKEITTKNNFSEFNNQIDTNLSEISDSIFNICIIGPSRVGKSTLINAITYQEMSPVDTLPTTGVPIIMLPGHPEEVCVHFADGSKKTSKINLEFVAQYADQKKNKHNHKNVTLVNVKLNSTFLEKGFSITDVPGIDDINQGIKDIAKSTIYSADAILYVISVAPYADGEFKITDQHLADLKEIKDKMNRVFLIFNKIDKLDEEQIISLKKYINETLTDYSISDLLAHEPIFISSKESFKNRVQNIKSFDSVNNLEEVIVKYLVNGNLNGITNLLSNFAGSMELIKQLINISEVRLSDIDKSGDLQKNINTVRTELRELQTFIRNQRVAAYKEIDMYINDNFQNIISTLENDLKGKINNQSLPTQSEITTFLKNESDLCVSNVYEYVQTVTYDLQSKVNIWVSDKLKRVQINLNDIEADSTLVLPSIERFTGKIFNIYRIREDLSSNVLVTTFNFIGKIFTSFFGGLYNLFRSDHSLKDENIAKLITPARTQFTKIQVDFLNSISDHLNKVCRSIENKTVERTKIYLDTMQAELDKINTPLNQGDKNRLTLMKQQLIGLETKGLSQMLSIKDYANGIF